MFTVVIATRNRTKLFAEALESVLGQKNVDLEVVVVNDGSDPEHLEEYKAFEKQADERVRFFYLPKRPNGHGQAYVLNVGVGEARNPYVAFLDDDDTWTDMDYLARVAATIEQSDRTVDLHMSNQAAFIGETQKPGPIWIEGLTEIVKGDGGTPDDQGAYDVTVEQLLRCTGFCHINVFVIRRDLFLDIKGMDEGIRWECDRDLYLRLIDRAEVIKYSPHVVSRHNIPDPTKAASMTTSLGMLEKRLQQLRVLNKAALFINHPGIRKHARKHQGFALKKITEELVADGRIKDAAFYARQAFGARPTLKWGAYTVWLNIRRWM